jgi:hypothetical protein
MDPALVAIHDEVRVGTCVAPWTVVDDMVAYGRHLYIPPISPLLQEIMEAIHEDGHEGVHRTLHRLRRDFHFPNMHHLVQEFMRSCPTCQRYKSKHLHPAGLLMPLPVSSAVWADISLDFVEALPRVNGKTVILSVINRFNKYYHFIPLVHPYTVASVAQAFFADIVRLHGILQSIVSDRDPVFTSTFWCELMRLMGTKLHMTSAFHPQSDGQTEAANRIIVMYLRCFTRDRPRQWLRWLLWGSYEPGETRVATVAQDMEAREAFLADVCYCLEQAQASQKLHYDRQHRQVSYQVGDWALLRLRQRAASSLPRTTTGKLKP